MSLSVVGLGILVFLQAAFAQSSARAFDPQDIDEELIDALASMAIAGDRNINSNMRNRDADASLVDYASNGYPEGWDLREAEELASWASAPRQFAYKPNDPRFYLPAPTSYDSPKTDEIADIPMPDPISLFRGQPPTDENASTRQMRQKQLQPNINYMKKNQQETVMDGGADKKSSAPGAIPSQEVDPNDESASPPVDSNNNNGDPSQYQVLDSHGKPSHVSISQHGANSPDVQTSRLDDGGIFSSIYGIAIVAGVSAAFVVGVVAAGICWYRIHERVKAAADVDYPAYGVTGPSKDVSPNGGDRKLAQSAHMYHYQHQKQQMAALQKSPIQGDRQGSGGSDVESEDDNEDGDYTVYECPGLAGLCNSGEMEVKNPLYDDEPTPATPNIIQSSVDDAEAALK